MTTEIFTHAIVKETAKAVLVAVMVSWGEGGLREKQLWMPKSVIVSQREFNAEQQVLEVKSWFIQKTESENAFHGYQMEINKLAKAI